MDIRSVAIAALLAFAFSASASADEVKAPQNNYRGMMGQGRGAGWGMMGDGAGPGVMMGQGYGYMGGCGMMGYGRDGARAEDYDTYIDGRIAFLKAELKITASQDAVWTAYADALRTNSQIMTSMHKQMREAFQRGDRSPVTFMDLHIRTMKSRLAALEALKPATETLYAALSKEQREKADDVLPFMGCM